MRWLVVAACLLFATNARAELSLEEVLASVDQHHPLLLAEVRSAQAARALVRSAQGEFDPKLGVEGKSAVLGYYDTTHVDAKLEQPTPMLGASLYAGYRLGTGNIPDYYGELATLEHGEVRGGLLLPLLQNRAIDERRAGVARARAEVEVADADVRALLLSLQLEAASAYFAWRAAGARLSIAEGLLTLAQVRQAQVESKVALGSRPPIDNVDNARAIFERTQRLVSARRDLEKSSYILSLFLRDPDGSPRVVDASELPPSMGAPMPQLPTDADAMARALETRPELDAYEAALRAASVDVELADNQVNPRLDVYGEVSRDFGDDPEALRPSRRPTVVEVGAKLSWPLPLRKARGKRDALELKLRALEEKASFARDKISYEVRDAYSALRAAKEKVEAASGAVEAAETLAEGERTSFELGATTLLFVNLREQTAADARAKWVDALAEWNTAAARAQVALGEPLFVAR